MAKINDSIFVCNVSLFLLASLLRCDWNFFFWCDFRLRPRSRNAWSGLRFFSITILVFWGAQSFPFLFKICSHRVLQQLSFSMSFRKPSSPYYSLSVRCLCLNFYFYMGMQCMYVCMYVSIWVYQSLQSQIFMQLYSLYPDKTTPFLKNEKLFNFIVKWKEQYVCWRFKFRGIKK